MLNEGDDFSYASSLSSTPILQLKQNIPSDKRKSAFQSPSVSILEKLTGNQYADKSLDRVVDEDVEDEVACCLCHCGMDCSDRALFFPKDRKKELEDCANDSDQDDYYFTMQDPYLPESLYDPHNALVYCESCDRLYHQKCHFVPILVLPRGEWNCLICSTTKNKNKAFFSSPPTLQQRQAQMDFEFSTRNDKALLWSRQLKSVKTFLNSQASNIRMAKAALHTLTSTKRNRAMIFENQRKLQELAQTILRMTTAKFKMRQVLMSLEDLRVSPNGGLINASELVAWCDEYPKHLDHIFPQGIDPFLKQKRVVPRTAEMKLDYQQNKDSIPTEIMCSTPRCEIAGSVKKKIESRENNAEKKSDEDSGITLDDLKCSICMTGDSTDDNDVILCDGQGCYRAFHMKCVYPGVTQEEIEDEDNDWFCPLCSAISNFIHQMQIACEGEDEDYDEDAGSEMEWDTPHDVFPNSKWEYETALKYSQGKQNDDINLLLSTYLGEEIGTNPINPVGSDSEDENDYSLFDEESFAERRKTENVGDDESSDRESQATWLSSSVEGKIGQAELAALSEEDNDDESSGDDSSNSSKSRRKSRRLRNRENERRTTAILGADFDRSNIVQGKRNRKTVDYRKLNDSLFGNLSEIQKRKLDDADDYKSKKKKAIRNETSDDTDANDEDETQKGEDEAEDSSVFSSDESESSNSGGEESGSDVTSSGEEDDADSTSDE